MLFQILQYIRTGVDFKSAQFDPVQTSPVHIVGFEILLQILMRISRFTFHISIQPRFSECRHYIIKRDLMPYFPSILNALMKSTQTAQECI